MSRLDMTQERYVAALKRQRARIADGLEFTAVDSDQTGNKFTHASWGLCSNDKEAWPDAQDHLWPDKFAERGRVAPKYRNPKQLCPMQKKGGPNGCFYSCRIFKHREINQNKREESIALYDAALALIAPAGAGYRCDKLGAESRSIVRHLKAMAKLNGFMEPAKQEQQP
jgi:hypothetical protein